jgi:nicotinamidase-related amidase
MGVHFGIQARAASQIGSMQALGGTETFVAMDDPLARLNRTRLIVGGVNMDTGVRATVVDAYPAFR